MRRCHAINVTLKFDDNSEQLFENHNLIEVPLISVKPSENIKSHFKGIPIDGQWTLAVYDRISDNITGILYDWEMDMSARPCEESIRWSKMNVSNACDLGIVTPGVIKMEECPGNGDSYIQRYPEKTTSSNIFTPRYSHSAIAIHNNVYVVGGFAHGDVKETWRLNYASKSWTKLHGSHSSNLFFGQSSVLTPYGIIALGGLAEAERCHDSLYIYDIKTRMTSKLDTESM